MNISGFFVELRRRKVYKVAVGYCLVAWLLIQFATAVFPSFDIPHWPIRFLVLMLAICFPVALVLAWLFELTQDGLQRTQPVATATTAPSQSDVPSQSKPRSALWTGLRALGTLAGIVAIAGFIWTVVVVIRRPAAVLTSNTPPLSTQANLADGQTVLHVNPRGSDGAYLHVGDALHAAKSGDTIEIAPGQYRGEKLALEPSDPAKPLWNIAIRGLNRDEVVISGRPDVPVTRDPVDTARFALFRISNCYNVSITGITFEMEPTGTPSAADLLHFHDSDVTIESCRLRWSTNGGIAHHYRGTLVIQRTVIESNKGPGLTALGDKLIVSLNACEFRNNGGSGVDVAGGGSFRSENSVFAANGGSGVRLEGNHTAATLFRDSSNDNVGDGISVAKGATATMTTNRFVNNGVGINLHDPGENVIASDNSVSGNRYGGILLDGVQSGEVRNNLCTGNGIAPPDNITRYGMYLQRCGEGLAVRSNTIRDNAGIGVVIVAPDATKVGDLLIDSNSEGGIWFWGTKPFPEFANVYMFHQPKASLKFNGVPRSDVKLPVLMQDSVSAQSISD